MVGIMAALVAGLRSFVSAVGTFECARAFTARLYQPLYGRRDNNSQRCAEQAKDLRCDIGRSQQHDDSGTRQYESRLPRAVRGELSKS
ncbi:hypothetical protein GCM10009775_19960 [Microbacterium aoyamense]|uniref:Secreted protein n=1 Tax=Microbacterium aoyamense TaxID=344166 RepID=A0ABP5B0H2_9MICO